MAEENKFADEIISDGELDQVAGGTCYEMADDSRFLNSLNGSTDRYGANKMFFSPGTFGKELTEAWAKLGVEYEYSGTMIYDNTYKLNGKKITQEEARQHAMKVTGHYMTEKDWKW